MLFRAGWERAPPSIVHPTGHLLDEVVGDPGARPRADHQTQGAGFVLGEIRHAFVEIDIPFRIAANLLLCSADGVRRAGAGAQLAAGAELVGAKISGALTVSGISVVTMDSRKLDP